MIQSMFRTLSICIGIIIVVGIIFPVFLIVVPPLAWFYGRVMTYVWCGLLAPNVADPALIQILS